jgi:hypothetical protein
MDNGGTSNRSLEQKKDKTELTCLSELSVFSQYGFSNKLPRNHSARTPKKTSLRYVTWVHQLAELDAGFEPRWRHRWIRFFRGLVTSSRQMAEQCLKINF